MVAMNTSREPGEYKYLSIFSTSPIISPQNLKEAVKIFNMESPMIQEVTEK